MSKVGEAFIKVAERYERLAECEPDFNVAQQYRVMARHFKQEAFNLSDVKETDNGNAD